MKSLEHYGWCNVAVFFLKSYCHQLNPSIHRLTWAFLEFDEEFEKCLKQ